MNISGKLTALLSVAGLLMLGFCGLVSYHAGTRNIDRNLLHKARIMVSRLESSLPKSTGGYAQPAARAAARAEFPDEDVAAILVRGMDDELLLGFARSGEEIVPVSTPPGTADAVSEVAQLKLKTPQGMDTLASLSVHLSRHAAKSRLAAEMVRQLAKMALAILLLIVLVRLVTNRCLAAPLEQIRKAMVETRDKVASSDEMHLWYDQPLPVPLPKASPCFPELSDIGQCFTAMVEAIRAQQQALINNEENLRITLDSIGDAVIATDEQTRIVRMNPVAEKLTGWPSREAVGRPLAEVFRIIDGRTRRQIENPVGKIIETGRIVGLAPHAVMIARGGQERHIADSGAPICNTDHKTIGVVLVFRDVTEEHALQERLQQSQKMEAIGELAGGVAHDFNNMLAGIIGGAEMVGELLKDDSAAKPCLDIIIESAERAAELTAKLLAFARRHPAAFVTVDVHRTLEDTIALLKTSVDRRIVIEPSLLADRFRVIGDAAQLQSAFLNLGINAAQAMPNGGVIKIDTGTVELDAAYCAASSFDLKPGSYLEIRVTDSGHGIPEENIPRIFEPFFTTKARGVGTGLGLSAVLGTVQQHDGAITVSSKLKAGTCFKILLRLSAEDDVIADPVVPATIKGSGRILIVDDEPVIRRSSSFILSGLGYQPILAENGCQALKIFKEAAGTIDLVILDMIMPEMNGKECFAEMKKIDPNVRVVLSSGFVHDEDLTRMTANGLCGFIRKPYRTAALSTVIHDALKS